MLVGTTRQRPRPSGWDERGRRWHYFDAAGTSLCHRHRNDTWNLLCKDGEVHPDNCCKACLKKRAAAHR